MIGCSELFHSLRHSGTVRIVGWFDQIHGESCCFCGVSVVRKGDGSPAFFRRPLDGLISVGWWLICAECVPACLALFREVHCGRGEDRYWLCRNRTMMSVPSSEMGVNSRHDLPS